MVVLSDAMGGCGVEVQGESAVDGCFDGGRKSEAHSPAATSATTNDFDCVVDDRNEAVLDERGETPRI